jgi:hypothetical protein
MQIEQSVLRARRGCNPVPCATIYCFLFASAVREA